MTVLSFQTWHSSPVSWYRTSHLLYLRTAFYFTELRRTLVFLVIFSLGVIECAEHPQLFSVTELSYRIVSYRHSRWPGDHSRCTFSTAQSTPVLLIPLVAFSFPTFYLLFMQSASVPTMIRRLNTTRYCAHIRPRYVQTVDSRRSCWKKALLFDNLLQCVTLHFHATASPHGVSQLYIRIDKKTCDVCCHRIAKIR